MQKEKKFDIISFYKFIILDDLEKHQVAIADLIREAIKEYLDANNMEGYY